MNNVLIYAYAVSLPLTAFSIFPWFGFQLSYAITLILGILIIIRAFITGRISITARPTNVAVFIFWAASIFSVIGVVTNSYSELGGETPILKFGKQALALSFMTLMYFILVIILKEKAILINAIKLFVVSIFLTAIFGFYQFIGAFWDLPYKRLLFNNPSYHLAKEEYGLMGLFRVTSFSPEPSMFANSLLAVIPLMAICYLNKIKIFGATIFNAFFLVSMLIAMLLTFSRGGYIIILIILAIIYFFFKTINFSVLLRTFSLFFTLFSLTGLLISQFADANIISITIERLFSTGDITDLSILERSTSLVTAFNIFISHPIFGVGLGNFGLYFYEHMPLWGYMETDGLPAANNLILAIAAETGAVGLISFTYLIWVIIKEGLAAIKRNKEDNLFYSISVGIFMSFVAVLLHLVIGLATLSFSYLWFLIAGIALLNQRGEASRCMLGKEKKGDI